MSDNTTPPPPPAPLPEVPPPPPPTAPAYSQVPPSAPVAPAKSGVRPWIVVVGLLGLLAIIVVTIVVVISGIPKPGPPAGTFAEPQDAVIAFDTAYATQDCELFVEVTTKGFRRTYLGEDGFSCEAWLANAETLFIDGEYAYSMTIDTTDVNGTDAAVETTEVSGVEDDAATYQYRYGVHLADGNWRVYRIEDITPE